MDNLEQQLQQLRLIHKRITTNETQNEHLLAKPLGSGAIKNNNVAMKQKQLLQQQQQQNDNYVGRWDLMKKPQHQQQQQHLHHQPHLIKRRENVATLDNPIVLDQQLEALAHHKRQMEKRGLLQSSSSSTAATITTTSSASVTPVNDLLRSNNSPPSPVSSSYSELRHATDKQKQQIPLQTSLPTTTNPNAGNYMNLHYNRHLNNSPHDSLSAQDATDYYDFGNFSQAASSTYESIYEPINPRPSSQLSNLSRSHLEHSNSLTFNPPPYANLPGGMATTASTHEIRSPSTTVASTNNSIYSGRDCSYETESLTDYLDRSIDISECENYGNCCKCNEPVLGENSGCTAMNQIYHIECFTCTQCQINLQGKPFYAIENKAYCEYDYLQTLEKCSVCTKPILERILRATGKPYHPTCFTCVVCGKSLDGIPFTVDATNQNYCITDFHKKFAPRCCVCRDPIMPESGEEETVRVVALDRSFHLKCYKCEDCGLLLSSSSEGSGCYPLDDHVLCKSCNAKRVQLLTSSDL